MPLSEKDCAATYKVLVLGDYSVGKSAVLDRLMGREFKGNLRPTVCMDFVKKIFEVDGALIQLVIWDSAGHDRFHSITRRQYRDVKGVVLVYDVTTPQSFSHLQFWINSIQSEMQHTHNQYEPIPIVLCGNKMDMEDERQVDKSKGEKLVEDQVVFEFFETSAKCGDNIFEAFRRLAYHITDICNPKLMKSYHPSMIRQDDTAATPKNKSTPVHRKRKPKQKKQKSQKKKNATSSFSFLSGTLCCTSGH